MLKSRVGIWGTALVCAGLGQGCDTPEETARSPREPVRQATANLTATELRILGFEQLSDWQSIWNPATLSQSTLHSQGAFSLKIGNIGYTAVRHTQPLSSDGNAFTVVGYDIRIPRLNEQVNPWWFGDTWLYIDAPSKGINQVTLGSKPLTNPGQFNRIEFPIPAWIRTALSGNYSDLKFTIAINTTPGNGAHYLDRFTLGPGSCQPVNDNNPCTEDTCNAAGQPIHTPKPAGTSCGDSNLCNGAETCNATGVCQAGTPPLVDDGNLCTTDSCLPASGVAHVPLPSGSSCSDSNACNGAELCNATGVCAAGTPLPVDDGNPCTADSCDPASGVQHVSVPGGTSCTNGNPCDGSELCNSGGTCQPGTPVPVDDGNPCTSDSCDPQSGVLHAPVSAGTSCSDANACNGAEICDAAGICSPGVSVPTDDGNPCTADSCDPVAGVSHTPIPSGTSCGDANECNGEELCNQAGVCVAGTVLPVDDGNPCTSDSCDPVSGVAHVPLPAGASCGDSDVCNGNEICTANGACQPGSPLDADDDNPCTIDQCDPVAGIQHQPTPGLSCADGDVCNGEEICDAGGSCVDGVPLVLDDDNPCTADSCDPIEGISHGPVSAGAPCGDGNACNGAETCDAAGTCQSGTALNVDDGNACTEDTCAPETGSVSHTPRPAGTSCDLGECALGVCDATGSCQLSSTSSFDDGDPCTLEFCDAQSGFVRVTCPPLDPSEASNVLTSYRWMLESTPPVQSGVAPDTIQIDRAALLSGSVRDRTGVPLGDVTISVLGRAELGLTTTRVDGSFDLLVNGGGSLTLVFRKSGYLEAHRTTPIGWGEYERVPNLVLIPADSAVTPIDLAEESGFQVARGSEVTDDDGQRQATLLFPPDTVAVMVMPDGSQQSITQMAIRATEYTVGETGLEAMPAPLPPTSAYTYAFELNADEAVAAGATTIEFSQPLPFYVENFLDLPAGTGVPLGSYDRNRAQWVSHDNGVVIDVVAEAGGVAQVDVTGDGVADTGTRLQALGIATAELQQVAQLYQPGASLWRVLIPHFTQPWDCNFPAPPPPDAEPPPDPDEDDDDEPDDECPFGGASTIDCQSMTLREAIPLQGTDLSLVYSSATAKPSKYIKEIVLSGSEVPASLTSIDLEVTGPQGTTQLAFEPLPNQSYTYLWDGRDRFGRSVQGDVPITVTIGYNYDVVYSETDVFGRPGNGVAIPGADARRNYRLEDRWETTLGTWIAGGFGRWGIEDLHFYNAMTQTLYSGDGTPRAAKALPTGRTYIAGDGNLHYGSYSEARMGGLMDIATGPDGSTFVAELCAIKRLKDGFVTPYVSDRTRADYDCDSTGDGGPAVEANIDNIHDMAVAPDGTLYLSNTRNVRKVTPDGVISYVGEFHGTSNGHIIQDLAVGPDGALYVAHSLIVEKVDAEGRRTLVMGTGQPNGSDPVPPDGLLATEMNVNATRVEVDRWGNVYVNDTSRIIWKIGVDGRATRVAGCGRGRPGCNSSDLDDSNGAPATALESVEDFVVRDDGSLLVNEYTNSSNGRLVEVTPQGTIFRRSILRTDFTEDERGGIWYRSEAAVATTRLYRISAALPGLTRESVQLVPSSDGSSIFVFSNGGRHLRTVDALTGVTQKFFGYDAGGQLTSVTDSDGRETLISWSGSGADITGPFGQVTTLNMDPDGYLAQVLNPAGGEYTMTYAEHGSGLLASFTNPEGHQSTMAYDVLGRLVSDTNAAGGEATLTPASTVPDGWAVELTSPMGYKTSYEVATANGVQTRTNTFPNGLSTTQVISTLSGSSVTEFADGTELTTTLTSDPRFGPSVLLASKQWTLPSGLTIENEVTRAASVADVNDPFSLLKFEERETNGTYYAATTYDRVKNLMVQRSRAGRESKIQFDLLDRIQAYTSSSSVLPIQFTYDGQGRVVLATQGDRTYSMTYYDAAQDSSGYLSSLTDPLGQTVSFVKGADGLPTSVVYDDDTSISLEWDQLGQLLSVAPPDQPAHTLAYSPLNVLESYAPPPVDDAESTSTFLTDLERKLLTITTPDGMPLEHTYDAAGRLQSTTLPSGDINFTYYDGTMCTGCAPGRLKEISGPYGTTLAAAYDGYLLTSEELYGPVNGAVSWEYEDFGAYDFLPSAETVSTPTSESTVLMNYDADGAITSSTPPVGSDTLSVEYNADGQYSWSGIGTTFIQRSFTSYGEVNTQTTTAGGRTVQHFFFGPRDRLGRKTSTTLRERFGGTPVVYNYVYDNRNRLKEVRRQGIRIEAYEYDANGNRTRFTSPTQDVAAEYDAQDRLLRYGNTDYAYSADGTLASKTDALTGEITTYDYDLLGNLLGVELPDGRSIEYVVDGRGRRVGKLVDGVMTRQWLYRDDLNPVAELDGSGNLVSRFGYASHANVPDYMVYQGKVYRFIVDDLGSVRTAVNVRDVNDVLLDVHYSAFGLPQLNSGSFAAVPFGFAGGLYDPDTGLIRFGARDYDATVGRWTAKDPLLFDAGQTNLYAYVDNDPLNYVDPTGRSKSVLIKAAKGLLCWYYLWRLSDEFTECEEDLIKELKEDAKSDCLTDGLEKLDKDYSSTVFNCVRRKDDNSFGEMAFWCTGTAKGVMRGGATRSHKPPARNPML